MTLARHRDDIVGPRETNDDVLGTGRDRLVSCLLEIAALSEIVQSDAQGNHAAAGSTARGRKACDAGSGDAFDDLADPDRTAIIQCRRA